MVDGIGTTAFTWTPGGQLASEESPWSSDAVSYAYTHRLRSGLSLQQASASPWEQSYGYDAYRRLTNVTSQAGAFRTQYKVTSWNGNNTASELVEQLNLPGGSHIDNSHDAIGRLLSTALKNATNGTLNAHSYVYNDGHQRTKQTFLEGNYVDYGYDNIGQLKTAKGKEADTTTRPHEQFGYAYDTAWNLNYRTNNALTQSFSVNGLNQLTNSSRSGTFTVAGAVSITPTNVTVKDNANSPQPATLYNDESFARTNVTLLNGNNTFQAVAKDSLGRVDTNTVTTYLPSSAVCSYDSRGNLTNDGKRFFYYDSENQLTNVLVVGQWKSEFAYDGLMRRKVRKEFIWSGSAWVQTNEVRYVYEGRLVIQERHYTPQGSTLIPLNTVTYTRGNDLSGAFEGAGGIGGLLARSESSSTLNPQHSTGFYHSDGNGNITAMVSTNGLILARYTYDPYGNVLGMSGPLSEANLYRFSTKEWHEKSGLVYYLYRYYEPGLQRWINRDPIQERGGVNLFGFTYNTPINLFDRDGRVVPLIVAAALVYFGMEVIANAPAPGDKGLPPYHDSDPVGTAATILCPLPTIGGTALGLLGEELGVPPEALAAMIPAPKVPKAFPGLNRSKPKTPVQGGGGLRKRWKDDDGNIYEWDSQHGAGTSQSSVENDTRCTGPAYSGIRRASAHETGGVEKCDKRQANATE
jgi:RHS repeat-associated protein